MKRRRILGAIACTSVTFLAAVGCSQPTTNTPSDTTATQPESLELTVSAAASLQDAMKEIQPIYEGENPNITITYNFGSSGSLQQQIEQGAPADVFLSAAPKQMNALQEKDLLLEGTRQDLLKNSIVLVVPKESSSLADFKELETEKASKIAIGEPESVPAGQYSKEVLASLNLFEPLRSKFVFAKDVRQVLTYVETGNVDAGLVYATDAKVSDRVKVAATAPEGSHAPIIYPVAVLKDSSNPEAAKEFVEFLTSDRAKTIFKEYGFSTN